MTLSLWCGNYNTVHNDLIALADEVHQLDWKYFPRFVPDEPVRSAKKKTESKPKSQLNKKTTAKSSRPKQKSQRNSNKNSDGKNSEKKQIRKESVLIKRDKIPRVKKDEGSSWTDKFLKITSWSDKS